MRKAKKGPDEITDVSNSIGTTARIHYDLGTLAVSWITATVTRTNICDGEPITDRVMLLDLNFGPGSGVRNQQIEFPPMAAEALVTLLGGLFREARKHGGLPALSQREGSK